MSVSKFNRNNISKLDTRESQHVIDNLQHAVSAMVGRTGAGKSTDVMEAIYNSNNEVIIFVVEPTKPAVESLHKRMSDRLGRENVGFAADNIVRYNNPHLRHIRGNDNTLSSTKITRLVYCTAGHMLRIFYDLIRYALQDVPKDNGLIMGNEKVMKDVRLDFCQVLMLDESHEGRIDIDIIMFLWRFAKNKGAIVPRLLLASATLSMDASIFPLLIPYEIKVKGYPVDIEWHTGDMKPDSKELLIATAKVILKKHNEDIEERKQLMKIIVKSSSLKSSPLKTSPLKTSPLKTTSLKTSPLKTSSENSSKMSLRKYNKLINKEIVQLLPTNIIVDEDTISDLNIEEKILDGDLISNEKSFAQQDEELDIQLDNIEDNNEKISPILNQDEFNVGDIWLCFCSGANEVETVCEYLRNVKDETLHVIALYANLHSSNIDETFSFPPLGHRKIIVATNIAETSITIDGLSGVFDTMTEKYGGTSSAEGFKLFVTNISKSSAKQRAGRTGRVKTRKPAFCYRMCTESFYNTLMENRPNEILRIPLHSTVIEILDIGLDPKQLFADMIIRDSSFPNKIDKAENILELLGMIRKDNISGIPVVTHMGHFAPRFPLSVRGAATLYRWHEKELPISVGIYVTCIIDSYDQSYFFYPRREMGMSYNRYQDILMEHYEQYFKKYDATTNIGATLNMWLQLFNHFKTHDIDRKSLSKYASDNSLNNKKLMECLKNIKQTINVFTSEGYRVITGPFTVNGVLRELTPILRSVYSDQIFIKQSSSSKGEITYRINNESADLFTLETRDLIAKSSSIRNKIIGLRLAEDKRPTGKAKRIIKFEVPYDFVETFVPGEKPKISLEEEDDEDLPDIF